MRIAYLASAAIAALAFTTPAFAGSADINVTATVSAALSVNCGADLTFGTITLAPDNLTGTVTMDASSGAISVGSNGDIIPVGSSNPASCTISDENGGNATASLAGGGGTFTGTTLSGATLTDGSAGTLDATFNVSKATAIGNETIYVGGVLTIPAAFTGFSPFSQTLVLTITD